MTNYTLTQRQLANLKRRLTIAKKKGPRETIAECRHAFQTFEQFGYPDCWADWERAGNDAEFELCRTFTQSFRQNISFNPTT